MFLFPWENIDFMVWLQLSYITIKCFQIKRMNLFYVYLNILDPTTVAFTAASRNRKAILTIKMTI